MDITELDKCRAALDVAHRAAALALTALDVKDSRLIMILGTTPEKITMTSNVRNGCKQTAADFNEVKAMLEKAVCAVNQTHPERN